MEMKVQSLIYTESVLSYRSNSLSTRGGKRGKIEEDERSIIRLEARSPASLKNKNRGEGDSARKRHSAHTNSCNYYNEKGFLRLGIGQNTTKRN